MATAFSIASILSISNFLQILFGSELQQNANPTELEKILNSIYAYFITFGKQNALWFFAGIIFVIYFLKDLFTYLGSYVVVSMRAKILRNMRNDLFKSYTSQNIAFISQYKKGDLLSRISTDLIEYDQNALLGLQNLISVVINIVLHFAILLYMNPVLTLTTLVIVPLVSGVVSTISRKLRRSSRQMQQESAELISRLEETISGLRIIKSHTAIELVCKGFENFNSSYTKLRTKIYRKVDLASPQSEFFGNCMVIGILLLGTSYIV
jgi:subfamily B ATP-binding cassette protein MsbA